MTTNSVACGSACEGAKSTALVPIHRHEPAMALPSRAMTVAGAALSSPASSRGRMGRFHTIENLARVDDGPLRPREDDREVPGRLRRAELPLGRERARGRQVGDLGIATETGGAPRHGDEGESRSNAATDRAHVRPGYGEGERRVRINVRATATCAAIAQGCDVQGGRAPTRCVR